jgi:ATP-dependent helicase HrpA
VSEVSADDGTASVTAAHRYLSEIAALLGETLAFDRRKFVKQRKNLKRHLTRHAHAGALPAGIERRLVRLHEACSKSAAIRRRRMAIPVRLEFARDLPVSAQVEALKAMLASHQVVIVSGQTGSGKSTQLPKICLAAGRGDAGRIGHTQPRRIAARAIARRIAEETGTREGELVGHCVRFDDNLSPHARIKVMTDGILLNEIHSDPWLEQYDTLILDEVHERTLNIDVLLGHLKRVLAKRADLKLIITSATLDVASFAEFYGNAAVCQIAGRSHPVEVRYRPPAASAHDSTSAAVIDAVRELDQDGRADILVFLPGEREIRETEAAISRLRLADTEVLKLYARLAAGLQARIFQPEGRRRIILATNVAETSLTVPRVRHVIDSGLARVSRYSTRRKLQQLPVEKISRANADQRLGRCGREAPGICIRLYDEFDYDARRAAVEPEIQRTNLAGVILRLNAMGVSDIGNFPLLERPPERLIKDGYNVLQEIGAIDATRELSAVGRSLTAYPVDPRLARVLCAAGELGCLREALIIVAALSIADPRERPHEMRDAADHAHAQFADKRSDFMWFVNAWPLARELAGMSFRRQQRRARQAFLSVGRTQEWVQLHDFLASQTRNEGLVGNVQVAGYKAIHCALAAGFPSLVGEWQGDRYSGCRNLNFVLHPSSVLHRQEAKWILASEIVESDRPYARLAARIEPQWLARVAKHLIRRSYDAPHWDAQRGCARVTEIQRFFGLVLSASHLVELATVDATAAREALIAQGLIDGDLGAMPDFLTHNCALIARIQALEARSRRRDLVASRGVLQEFYEARIPSLVTSRRALLRWLRGGPERAAALYMDEADASSEQHHSVPAYLFPEDLVIAGTVCPLTYRFEPGTERDGISVRVPLVLLPSIETEHFDRLVPGMLSAKVEGLLRALPKSWRRHFSPAREYAMAAVEALAEQQGPLIEALACVLSVVSGLEVESDLFEEHKIALHLRCWIELVDASGAEVAGGRDLGMLKAGQLDLARHQRDALAWNVGGDSKGGWTFGDVPERLSVAVGNDTVVGFPALVDATSSVRLKVFDTAPEAAVSHLEGVSRLLLLACGRQLKAFERAQPRRRELALTAALFGFTEWPGKVLAWAIARRWTGQQSEIRGLQSYMHQFDHFQAELVPALDQGLARMTSLFARGAAIRASFEGGGAAIPQAARADIRTQLDGLLGPNLATAVAGDNAQHHDRYLDAVDVRLERLRADPGKDLRKLVRLDDLWRNFLSRRELAREHAGLDVLFEEYRVALFAPELGTAVKISEARLKAELDVFSGVS